MTFESRVRSCSLSTVTCCTQSAACFSAVSSFARTVNSSLSFRVSSLATLSNYSIIRATQINHSGCFKNRAARRLMLQSKNTCMYLLS